MKDVQPHELHRVLTFLPRNRFLFLLRKLEQVPEGLPPLQTVTILKLALYNWFAHLDGYISDDQQQRVVAAFATHLNGVAQGQWGDAPAVLTLTDGRYAAIHGCQTWYDYELDGDLDALPGPTVTHISCNLTSLLGRTYERIEELRGGKDAAAKRRDGSAG